jgi:hypothetical protein
MDKDRSSTPTDDEVFGTLDRTISTAGLGVALDLLIQRFLSEGDYARVFQARLMKKRHELALPLFGSEPLAGVQPDQQRAYEAERMAAARDAGELYLATGEIECAWVYLRAVGDLAPVAAAIENLKPREGLERVIEIALFEGVNPRRGFELVLEQYGLCRAIGCLAQYPDRQTRRECISILIRALHKELGANIRCAIARQEGHEPETPSIPDLIAERDWLFAENRYYIDTSHLISALQFSIELDDPAPLRLALELTQYGPHLSPMFQYRGTPPFEDVYLDYAVYLRAVMGAEVDAAIAHFRRKVVESDTEASRAAGAQVLVNLMNRAGRYADAVEVAAEYLKDLDPEALACPALPDLCRRSGDFTPLMRVARTQGDLLTYVGAAAQGCYCPESKAVIRKFKDDL